MSSSGFAKPWCAAISFLIVLGTARPVTAEMRSDNGTEARVTTHVETLDASNHFDSGLIVESISIEGNNWIASEAIRKVIKTRPGDRFDRRFIMEDLRAIEKLGYFNPSSIKVIPELASDNGVGLRFCVSENPLLRKVNFVGNRRISTSELNRLFLTQLWKPRSRANLQAAISEIERRYRKLGCRFTKVESLELPDGTLGILISEIDPAIRAVPKQSGVILVPPPKITVPNIDERVIHHLRNRASAPAPRVIPRDPADNTTRGLSDGGMAPYALAI